MKRKERMARHEDLQREMQRGTGRTHAQIKNAPKNAVFVWCNGDARYPKSLAAKLDRADLEIVTLETLTHDRWWKGRVYSAVILDHAAADHMEQQHWNALRLLRAWARPMEEAL